MVLSIIAFSIVLVLNIPNSLMGGGLSMEQNIHVKSKESESVISPIEKQELISSKASGASTNSFDVVMQNNEMGVWASEIVEEIRTNLDRVSDEKVLTELGKLIKLIPHLGKPIYLKSAEVAVKALMKDPPLIPLAKEIRKGIAWNNSTFNVFPHRDSTRRSPAVVVVAGLALLLFLALPSTSIFISRNIGEEMIFGVSANLLLSVAIFGAIGSVISILVRLPEFSDTSLDPVVLFLTGMFKPIIGVAFAVFLLYSIKSGLFPISIPSHQEMFFFISLAFVAGFSERFAHDVVGRVDRRVRGPK